MSRLSVKPPELKSPRLPANAARSENSRPSATTPRRASRSPIWRAGAPRGIARRTAPWPAPFNGWKSATRNTIAPPTASRAVGGQAPPPPRPPAGPGGPERVAVRGRRVGLGILAGGVERPGPGAPRGRFGLALAHARRDRLDVEHLRPQRRGRRRLGQPAAPRLAYRARVGTLLGRAL